MYVATIGRLDFFKNDLCLFFNWMKKNGKLETIQFIKINYYKITIFTIKYIINSNKKIYKLSEKL